MTSSGRGRWPADARLRCVACDGSVPLGPAWSGCEACGGPLVVDYGADGMAADIPQLPLGHRGTPLVAADPLLDGLWLKCEGANPTGSHKDRFHAVATAVASAFDCAGVVTRSTGNHGVACAAFAARAGLRCSVCLEDDATDAIRVRLAALGAEVVAAGAGGQEAILERVDAGWCPSTAADPRLSGRANPYGQEGYRAIAQEIVDALSEPPAVVAVPAAGGDTVYGIAAGFAAIAQRGGPPPPLLLAIQPAVAAPLLATEQAAASEPVAVPPADTLALSASASITGWHATLAVRRDGHALAVPEDEIAATLRSLWAAGYPTEPTSALALAGLRRALRLGLLPATGPRVAVITSAGIGWERDIARALPGPSPLGRAA